MKHVFLTACRNEERIVEDFVREFAEVVQQAGIAGSAVLHVVDDLSLDGTCDVLARSARERGLDLGIIRAPTNLGNQGAMFYGLQRIDVGQDDVLVTFDCDGEDDVRSIPEILELGRSNPSKLVLVERGRRHESLGFKFCFAVYKALFRFLTARTVIPNNFMLVPGAYLPPIRRSPLAAVHLAYGILKLGFPYVATTKARRPRYGGASSQSIFMLVSHGMVGLMVFYEVVVAKLFALLFLLLALALALTVAVAVLPPPYESWRPALLGALVATTAGMVGLLAFHVSAATALVFKVSAYTLLQGEPPSGPGAPAPPGDGGPRA